MNNRHLQGERGCLMTSLDEADRSGRWPEIRERFESAAADCSTIEQLISKLYRTADRGENPCVAAPYRHVNGFSKLLLAEFPRSQARLTLHFWPQSGEQTSRSRPHDHRFEFSSIFLGGQQQFIDFVLSEPGPDSDEFVQRTYRPYASGKCAVLRGRQRLVGLEENALGFRTALRLPERVDAHTVHSVETLEATACASLVLRGPRVRREANVYYAPETNPSATRVSLQLGNRLSLESIQQHMHIVQKMLV